MTHRATTNERLSHLRHGNGALHASRHAVFFKPVLEREGIDDGREHAHVIPSRPLDAALASSQAAKNIAATDDDDDLDAELAHLANLSRHVVDRFRADADAGLASQRFATQLEQDTAIFRIIRLGHKRVAKCRKNER